MSENTLFSLDDTGVKEIQATYTPEANKTIVGKLRVAAFPNYKLVEITWENYSNLTEEEKNSETIYFITDKEIISFKGILYADDYNKIDNTPLYLDENNEVVINENYQAFFDLLINKDIEGNTNEIIVSDGEGWAKGQDIVINKIENSNDEVEYRIGVDNYVDKYTKKKNSKITFTDDIFDKNHTNIYSNIFNFLTIEDSAKVNFSEKSQLLLHDEAQVHIDGGAKENNDLIYQIYYYLPFDEQAENSPSQTDIKNNENTIIRIIDSEYNLILLTVDDFINKGFKLKNTSMVYYTIIEEKYHWYFSETYSLENEKTGTGSPQFFIHGPCTFNMDNGIKYDSNTNSAILPYYIVRYTLIYDEEQEKTPEIEEFYTNPNVTIKLYNTRTSEEVTDKTFEQIERLGYVFRCYWLPYHKNNDKKIWYLDSKYSLASSSGPKFIMRDMASMSVDGNSQIRTHNSSLISTDGNFQIQGHDNAQFYMGGSAFIKADSEAQLTLDGGSIIMNVEAEDDGQGNYYPKNYEPAICMQNGSQIIFNSGEDKIGHTSDPILVAGPQSIEFVGKGSTGTSGHDPTGITENIYIGNRYEGSITIIDTECTEKPKYLSYLSANALKELYNQINSLISSDFEINRIADYGFVVEEASNGYSVTVSNFIPMASYKIFGSPSDLIPENKNPRIRIADETMIVIDAYGNDPYGKTAGSNYIKISGNNGGQVQIHLTDNIFQQMSGNAHSEMHDDSKLIMRGNYKQAPWYDYVIGIEESRRPVQQGDNGPMVGLYDNPVVMIRGTWEDVEYISGTKEGATILVSVELYNKMLTEYNNLTTENRILSNFSDEVQTEFKPLIAKVFNWNDSDVIDCVISSVTSYSGTDKRVFIKEIEYKKIKQPENWSSHLEEKENNPYIEIIESSKVKLSGHAKVELTENFSISTDENGFNFSDGTSSVSFTLAELQNLKALLSN